jgi:protoheme IX farnesyltransferase
MLLKGPQTGLLLATGLAGYMSASCPIITWQMFLTLGGSLFLAISGSTMLNMVYDRDIDFKMQRTCRRPLPSSLITVREVLVLGVVLAGLGVCWAFMTNILYGLVVFAGILLNVIVYTIFLKRRTSWSIVWGGIAGGMPILAGRVLGIGQVDLIGLLLTAAVLFWIPTHIITFTLKYAEDYRLAGIPVFPNTHNERFARLLIGISTCIATIAMLLSAWLIGLRWGYLFAILGLSIVLIVSTLVVALRSSPKWDFALFRLASVYMLTALIMIIIGM